MVYQVQIIIKPLEQIANPEGQAIERALAALSFSTIDSVRVGKVINFNIRAVDSSEAHELTQAICNKLLVNPVMQYSEISITAVAD